VPLTLAYAQELYEAVRSRDEARVRYLIETARASWIPREVREEALATARLPLKSYRAPIYLLTYIRRLEQLLLYDPGTLAVLDGGAGAVEDAAAATPDPAQLELLGTSWTPSPTPDQVPASGRERRSA
jgi:hypothetical protein